ncbi:MAG: hypothetical protein OXF51_05150 [Alphaproteobacteria bacterium]|nr:hypothetical protein [Alphaproteobacteria bacterium]
MSDNEGPDSVAAGTADIMDNLMPGAAPGSRESTCPANARHRQQGLDLRLVEARQVFAKTPARGHGAKTQQTATDPVLAQRVKSVPLPAAL